MPLPRCTITCVYDEWDNMGVERLGVLTSCRACQDHALEGSLLRLPSSTASEVRGQTHSVLPAAVVIRSSKGGYHKGPTQPQIQDTDTFQLWPEQGTSTLLASVSLLVKWE